MLEDEERPIEVDEAIFYDIKEVIEAGMLLVDC